MGVIIRPKTANIGNSATPDRTKSLRRKVQSFKKSDILRAMDAAKAGGLNVGMVEVTRDGAIRLAVAPNGTGDASDDMFTKWENRL